MDQSKYYTMTVKSLWKFVRYALNGIAAINDILRWMKLATDALMKLGELLQSSSVESSKQDNHISYDELLKIHGILYNCLKTDDDEQQYADNDRWWSATRNMY